MGAKDTMNSFFVSMNEQAISPSGYGSKIIATHMGPFSWDENLGAWVNVNNGMRMNNISFQDMFMSDYDTTGDGDGNSDRVVISGSFGSLALTPMSVANTLYWASTTGADTNIANAGIGTFTQINYPVSISLTIQVTSGANSLQNIKYSLNGGAATTYSTPLSIGNGNTLKIGVTSPTSIVGDEGGNILVTNAATGRLLATIGYSCAAP